MKRLSLVAMVWLLLLPGCGKLKDQTKINELEKRASQLEVEMSTYETKCHAELKSEHERIVKSNRYKHEVDEGEDKPTVYPNCDKMEEIGKELLEIYAEIQRIDPNK